MYHYGILITTVLMYDQALLNMLRAVHSCLLSLVGSPFVFYEIESCGPHLDLTTVLVNQRYAKNQSVDSVELTTSKLTHIKLTL